MTRAALQYWGKGGTYIHVDLLHKAEKGMYYKDIIRAVMKSRSSKIGFCLTTDEAVILSCGLSHAVMLHNIKKKKSVKEV